MVQRVLLDTQKTVSYEWYTEQYLHNVFESLKNLRSNLRMGSWFFHHDNAPAHHVKGCIKYLITILFVLCDVALFFHVKLKMMCGGFTMIWTFCGLNKMSVQKCRSKCDRYGFRIAFGGSSDVLLMMEITLKKKIVNAAMLNFFYTVCIMLERNIWTYLHY